MEDQQLTTKQKLKVGAAVFVVCALHLVIYAAIFLYMQGIPWSEKTTKCALGQVNVVALKQPLKAGQHLTLDKIKIETIPERYAPPHYIRESSLKYHLGQVSTVDVPKHGIALSNQLKPRPRKKITKKKKRPWRGCASRKGRIKPNKPKHITR